MLMHEEIKKRRRKQKIAIWENVVLGQDAFPSVIRFFILLTLST